MGNQTKREKLTEVSFSITGEFLTEHARHMTLSKDWRGAIKLIAEGVDGASMDIALAVLRGEKQFVGECSRDLNTLDLVEDSKDRPETQGYLKTLAFQNAGLLNVSGKVFRPRWQVEALGPEDFEFASHKGHMIDSDEFLILRAQYYAGTSKCNYHVTLPKNHDAKAERVDFRDKETSERIVMWEPYDDYPIWITPHNNIEEAIADFLANRRLDTLGADTEILDLKTDNPDAYKAYLRRGIDLTMEEEEERNDLLSEDEKVYLNELREKIVAQAGPIDGEGWMRMGIFSEDNLWSREGVADSYLMVPKQPFFLWALKNCNPVGFGLIAPWKTVSPSGMKMYNDDALHSDWVIGAGFDPESFYKDHKLINDNAYAVQMDMMIKLMKFEFSVLSKSDKKFVEGRVKVLAPGETLEKGEVGVIASASVEYDAALRSAAMHDSALICMTGGPLAHVAVVGRELNVPIILWDKAGELDQWMKVSIDLVKGTIKVSGR